MQQPIFTFDPDSAKAAGPAGASEGGAYPGTIRAAIFTSARDASSQSQSMEFALDADVGTINYLRVSYVGRDGNPLRGGTAMINAIMGLTKVKALHATEVQNEQGEIELHCRELEGKPIGFVLQKVLYTKNDGGDGYRFEIRQAFGTNTRKTYKEAVDINSKYGPFVLDLFADRDNAKCEAFYSAEDNALTQDWSARLAELNGSGYANPPYSRAMKHDEQYITGMRHIMAHTLAMREAGGRYVFLIKAATGEVWWPEEADHVAFIRGRISFDLPVWYRPEEGQPSESSAGFGAAIAVFDKAWRGPKFDYVTAPCMAGRRSCFKSRRS